MVSVAESKKMLVPNKLMGRDDLHLARKLWHVSCGVIGLIYFYQSGISGFEMGKILMAMGFASYALDTLRIKVDAVNKVVLKIMGPLMRESEVKSYSGFSYYAFGAGLTLLCLPEKVALLGCFYLIFGDPMTSLMGVLYGKRMIFPKKSWVGSTSGFITCFVITVIFMSYLGFPISNAVFTYALVGGLLGSSSELLGLFMDDNFTIPTVSGLGLSLLNLELGLLF